MFISWLRSIQLTDTRLGTKATQERSRTSTSTRAPGCAKRYVLRVTGLTIVSAVTPTYSKTGLGSASAARAGTRDRTPGCGLAANRRVRRPAPVEIACLGLLQHIFLTLWSLQRSCLENSRAWW